jgi:hypothetical protein
VEDYMSDRIQEMVTLPFFNETLTSTVIDIDRESAILFLNEYYDSPCPLKIGKYLAVVGEFRLEVDG